MSITRLSAVLCGLFLMLCFGQSVGAVSASESKQATLERLRRDWADKATILRSSTPQTEQWFAALDSDGRFVDLRAEENRLATPRFAQSMDFNRQNSITNHGLKVWPRLEQLAARVGAMVPIVLSNDTVRRLLRALVYYGGLEYDRNPHSSGRFHGSCFAIPRHASTIYFSLFEVMNTAPQSADPLVRQSHDYLQKVAFQSWTQPYRHELSDHDVVSVERFRGHVWWVGGNALRYRPVLESALMQRSERMMDVLFEVATRSLSVVSQSTYDQAFWIEGMTADGSGWGHGMQNLVWGYPIDGVIGAFDILRALRGSAYDARLSEAGVSVLMNYIRGSSFFHFKGVNPPLVDRYNMAHRNNVKGSIPSVSIARTLIRDWASSLTAEQLAELKRFVGEAQRYDVRMEGYPEGWYSGSRYFYNNDALVHKDSTNYLLLNMGSFRVDGLESAYPGSSGFNLYAADGVTLFQRSGHEYRNITGAMNLNGWPGTTTRQTPVPLRPIVNWRGYTSAYDFAAGATSRKGDFAAGFINLKINATGKSHPCDTVGASDPNPTIFGVKAHKSYFMFGHQFLALGAGIANQQPDKEGDICTTIEQTFAPSLFTSDKGLVVPHRVLAPKAEQTVVNEGIAYTVLSRHTTGRVEYSRTVRPTHWNRLGAGNRVDESEVPVFEMRINHGREVLDGRYAYVVALPENREKRLPRILANTPLLQAAESPSGKSFGAVVYDPRQTIKSRLGEFRVSAPVAIFVRQEGDSFEISVADALMDRRLNELRIVVNRPLYGEGVRKIKSNRYELQIDLPLEPHRGASVGRVWRLKAD